MSPEPSDQSLTQVLKKHKKIIGEDVAIDEPVKHITQKRGIIDLMLSRAIKRHRKDTIEHLVIELKAPKVKVGSNELVQTEKYAISVAMDERFKSLNTTWKFWLITDDYDDYVERKMDEDGLTHNEGGIKVYVKSWADLLEENRSKLQFFKEKLNFEVDRAASLADLKQRYSKLFEAVEVDEGATATPTEDTQALVKRKGKKRLPKVSKVASDKQEN